MIFQATPALSFNATHNYATRSPRLADILLSGARDVSIADNTKSEQARNSEVGFNFNHNNLSLDGSYFWQEVDGLLANGQVANHDGNGTYTGIKNVGWAKNRGYEVNARYTLGGLSARLGVAESKPEFNTNISQGTNVAANGTTSLIGFTQKQYAINTGRAYTAGLSYRFAKPSLEVGATYRKNDDAKGGVWMNDTEQNLNAVRKGYHTADVYANWKPFGNDKMNVNLAVNNVTDEYYKPFNASGTGIPAVGREYRVGVNFTY